MIGCRMVRNLSVPSPLFSACNTSVFYYAGSPLLPSINDILGSHSINEYLLSTLSRVVMQVCFLYFCRIVEVLNVRVSDVIQPDRVVLHGAKHSNSYVIYLPALSAQIRESAVDDPSIPLFPISYSKLYRDAVRIGINVRVSGSSSARRMHCARYVFSKMSMNSINGSELAGVLRHRSESSYLYYLK